MFFRLRGLALLLVAILLFPGRAGAQTIPQASLAAPNTQNFPHIDAYLTVYSGPGEFLTSLAPEQIQVLEDGRPLPIQSMVESRPGVQFVVAVNPGPSFAVRNSKGISRFDLIKDTLSNWARSRQGSSLDDWSLLATNGTAINHLNNPMDWLAGLNGLDVEARKAIPSLDTLFQAIDLAADSLPRPGMGRAVLFITGSLEAVNDISLQNLEARAIQQDVRVFVWSIAPSDSLASPVDNQLEQLASATGGRYEQITTEEFPVIEDYLEPLRRVYQVTYISTANQSGAHELAVEIRMQGQVITTPARTFDLNILPPDPTFISPALEIVRRLESDASPLQALSRQEQPRALSPEEQPLQVLIDFPDGRSRSLRVTRLFVDGELAAENTTPPFDKFTWDLSPYETSGTHLLKVEAEDVLGLRGTSMETQVLVTVEELVPSRWEELFNYLPAAAGIFALVGSALVLLAMVWSGRLQPYARLRRLQTRKQALPKPEAPAAVDSSGRRLTGWVNRLQWPHRRVAPQADAFLTYLSTQEAPLSQGPIAINADEITLGCDPSQATLVLNDPSVASLHARLIRENEQDYRLFDHDSVAGTWVNYAPVPQDGTRLSHGDLVHVGRASFRFSIRQASARRKPVMIQDPLYEEGQSL